MMRTSAQDPRAAERPGAYALIQLSDGHIKEVAEAVKTLPVVQSVAAVRGPYQLIAALAVEDATLLRQVDGVERVVTAALVGGSRARATPAPGRRWGRGFSIPQPCGTPA